MAVALASFHWPTSASASTSTALTGSAISMPFMAIRASTSPSGASSRVVDLLMVLMVMMM